MFSAEDVRQYAYCPRKIYYRYVARRVWKETPKMSLGKRIHEEFCRSKDRDFFEGNVRYYNLRLEDKDLGLYALIDVVEWDGEKLKVIELKTGYNRKKIHYPDRMQVVAEAILVESYFNTEVKEGGIWFSEDNSIKTFPIDDRDRISILRILDEMNVIVREEFFPDVGYGKKCRDCECKRLCWWI